MPKMMFHVYDSARRLALIARPSLGAICFPIAVLAVCEVIYLIQVNHALASHSRSLIAASAAETTSAPGETIPTVTGFDRSGRRLSVELTGGSRSLVFGVSPNCPACIASAPAIRRLADQAAARGMRVVCVSKGYLSNVTDDMTTGLPGTVVSDPTYRTYNALKLALVPQTVVLSAAGRVEAVAVGLLDEAKERQIASQISK
jgi:hypothetical protein